MRNFNKVIIMGNLVRDPEIRYLPSGMPVANFSIASNDKYKKGDELVENVSYLDVVVFSRQAENCNEYLSKGRPVLIEGRLQQRRWEAKDGTKRSKVEIVASNVIFLGAGRSAGVAKEEGDTDFETVSDDDIPF
jgi:single-strand DNA-binding protein